MEEIHVENYMADGSLCQELRTYLEHTVLPEHVLRMIAAFIRDGAESLTRNSQVTPAKSGEKPATMFDERKDD